MKNVGRALVWLVILTNVLFVQNLSYAQEATDEEINRLKDEVIEREARTLQINEKIGEYDALIQEKENEVDSLQREAALIENFIAKAQLDLELTELEIDTADQQIRLLDLEIAQETSSLERKREVLKHVIRTMAREGDVSPMEIVFGSSSFSDMLEDLQRLDAINKNLTATLAETRQTREKLDEKRTAKNEKRTALKELKDELETKMAVLDLQQEAKSLLAYETGQSEEAYRKLVQELNQEQEYIEQELISIQKAIDQKIVDSDLLGDSSLLTWPLTNYRITVLFHDPTYPFRYLFEHSGLDLAAPAGTPIKSAAPGYVAVARTGRMYGNYVMVIHGNGIATLYAHLSRIDVVVDEFVGRGEVIGLVGSTGFSTGPHLHFEVRVDGIPVDPFGYLVD
ncbi:MAG: peptidoglycan DD-metalloendopeptidase family protein [Patescibacteria group bacterium]